MEVEEKEEVTGENRTDYGEVTNAERYVSTATVEMMTEEYSKWFLNQIRPIRWYIISLLSLIGGK